MEFIYKTLKDIDLKNKKVVLRLDLNLPIYENKILDDTRINASLETIKYLLKNNCKIIILSHLGRINCEQDIKNNDKSLKIVYDELVKKLPEIKIYFCNSLNEAEIKKAANKLKNQEILLLENTRYFNVCNISHKTINKESGGDEELAKFFASLGEVYINDAFATIHRNHASNAIIAKYQPNNAVGFLVEKELKTLSKILDHVNHPFVAIFGGGKVRDKINVIYKVLEIADKVIISGGLTYTFAKALGLNVGISRTEDDLLDVARDILKKDINKKIVLASDFIGVDKYEDKPGKAVDIDSKEATGLMGLDIGPKTEAKYKEVLKDAKTVFYNGPLGVTEMQNFQHGTKTLFDILSNLVKNGAEVIIGGGDSASAAINFGYKDKFSFISTGGGASMAYLEQKDLPGLSNMNKNKGLTPHIGASKEEISKTVLVCGDPLRAKWLADNYLSDVKLVTNIRNMSGYSGYYKDQFITVMGHGMGMPSIGIYSYELFKFYDVDLIIRLGTAGGLDKDLKVRSLILAKEVYSDSNYANELGLKDESKILKLDHNLDVLAKETAKLNDIKLLAENVISTDCFYTCLTPKQLQEKNNSKAVEMEIFALYANAIMLKKKAIGILTISDNIITHEEMSAYERQTSLKDMAKLGLEIIYNYVKNNKINLK